MSSLTSGAIVCIVLILAVTLCSVVSSLSTAWSARARYRAEVQVERERRIAAEAGLRHARSDPAPSPIEESR